MRVRESIFCGGLAAVLSGAVAIAQTPSSPVGTWRSAGIVLPAGPGTATIELVVSRVAPDQSISGRFTVYSSGMGGTGGYGCNVGPVTGTFDGAVLKAASQETNLCPARFWELKLQGEQMAGQYRGATGGFIDLAFTRN